MAAQLTATKGLSRRGLRSWIMRATSSLPVPLSPVSSTAAALSAMAATCSRSWVTWGERPTR